MVRGWSGGGVKLPERMFGVTIRSRDPQSPPDHGQEEACERAMKLADKTLQRKS